MHVHRWERLWWWHGIEDCCNDLTTKQNQYRELVASQLQDGENVECIHLQAFRHSDGWEEKKALAAEYSKKCVLEELKKIPPGSAYNYSDDDGSDSDYSYVGNKPTKTPGTLTALESKFYDSLPKCTMMMLGFDIGDKGEEWTSLWELIWCAVVPNDKLTT